MSFFVHFFCEFLKFLFPNCPNMISSKKLIQYKYSIFPWYYLIKNYMIDTFLLTGYLIRLHTENYHEISIFS